MILDKEKIQMIMAKNCMTYSKVIKKSGMPRSTFYKAISGCSVMPVTVGKIAKALETDVTEIIETEK